MGNALSTLWQWFPVAIEEHGTSPVIDWRFVGDRRFTEPFFQDSLACIPRDSRLSCRTRPEAFTQFSQFDCLTPSAFIFHSSRSGSTLIAQLLAKSTKCIVISEARVIDSALNLCRPLATRDRGIGVLKAVVRALGQRRCKDEQYLFVKLDSWHITHLPLIRQAFPDTPLLFVYRHPSEILSSHRRQRGQQMVPGLLDPEVLGIGSQPVDPADLDGFCLRVLSSFFRSAQLYTESGDLVLINYSELPALVWTQFARFFSISLNTEEVRFMQDRALRHSKYPIEQFATEGHQEPRRADADALCDLESCYNELEQLRVAQKQW